MISFDTAFGRSWIINKKGTPPTGHSRNMQYLFLYSINKRGKLHPALHITGTSYKAVYMGAGAPWSETGIERLLSMGGTGTTWQKQGQDGDMDFWISQSKSCIFYFEYIEYILNCGVFYFKLLLLLLRISTAVCVGRKRTEKEKKQSLLLR